MQLVAENEPESLALKPTSSVGDVPDTLAVHVLALPTVTGDGVHDTVVVVASVSAAVVCNAAGPDHISSPPTTPKPINADDRRARLPMRIATRRMKLLPDRLRTSGVCRPRVGASVRYCGRNRNARKRR